MMYDTSIQEWIITVMPQFLTDIGDLFDGDAYDLVEGYYNGVRHFKMVHGRLPTDGYEYLSWLDFYTGDVL